MPAYQVASPKLPAELEYVQYIVLLGDAQAKLTQGGTDVITGPQGQASVIQGRERVLQIAQNTQFFVPDSGGKRKGAGPRCDGFLKSGAISGVQRMGRGWEGAIASRSIPQIATKSGIVQLNQGGRFLVSTDDDTGATQFVGVDAGAKLFRMDPSACGNVNEIDVPSDRQPAGKKEKKEPEKESESNSGGGGSGGSGGSRSLKLREHDDNGHGNDPGKYDPSNPGGNKKTSERAEKGDSKEKDSDKRDKDEDEVVSLGALNEGSTPSLPDGFAGLSGAELKAAIAKLNSETSSQTISKSDALARIAATGGGSQMNQIAAVSTDPDVKRGASGKPEPSSSSSKGQSQGNSSANASSNSNVPSSVQDASRVENNQRSGSSSSPSQESNSSGPVLVPAPSIPKPPPPVSPAVLDPTQMPASSSVRVRINRN